MYLPGTFPVNSHFCIFAYILFLPLVNLVLDEMHSCRKYSSKQTNENKKTYPGPYFVRFLSFLLLVKYCQLFPTTLMTFKCFKQRHNFYSLETILFITNHRSIMHVRNVGAQCISNKVNVNKPGFTHKCSFSVLDLCASLRVKNLP